MRKVFIACLCGVAAASNAHQFGALTGGGSGFQLRLGWYGGAEFTSSSKKIRLEGVSAGIDVPLMQLPVVRISLSGTAQWGGSTRKGLDSDGTITRLMLTGRAALPGTKFYAIGGVGYASSKRRGTTVFETKASNVMQLGLGSDFGPYVGPVKPFAEVSYHTGTKVYRGWSFELGVRF